MDVVFLWANYQGLESLLKKKKKRNCYMREDTNKRDYVAFYKIVGGSV